MYRDKSKIVNSRAHASLSPNGADFIDRELIATTSRLSRLPKTVPSDAYTTSLSPSPSAIPAHQTTLNLPSGQDVHYLVNNSASSVRSPVISTIGSKSPLETPVSSFPPPLTQNDLKHPIRRPRTSTKIFQSSSDLVAHYGIPQRLPPVPSTSSRHHPATTSSKEHTELADFYSLSQNYIKMLSNEDPDPVATYSVSPMHPPISVSELCAPVVSLTETDPLDQLAALIGMSKVSAIPIFLTHRCTATVASPEFRQYSDFMTSPMPDLAQDSFTSPEETPYEGFLDTPLIDINDEFGTPMLPLFPDFEEPSAEESAQKPQYPPPLVDALYTISPTSPSLDTFESFAQPDPTPEPTSDPAPTLRRVSKATGIRKGITVDALLDDTAPTQPRKYITPSATSKKDVPATFARKRSRSVAFGDEEDELGDDLPLNDAEKHQIEKKRLKNTLAARKSRRRKLEQYQNMEKSRNEERQLKEIWKERAQILLQTLRKQGVNYPDFPEDVVSYDEV